MLKRINALILMLLLCSTVRVFAQFPYFESFKNATAPDIVFGGQPVAFLTAPTIDPVGDGYLRLTNASQDQKGFIHNKTAFPSKTGLKIEFEYFTYGGRADGITFFLYDAAVPDASFQIGGFGGSLGYAQYKFGSATTASPGVSSGYLGVGIDEYGNFSNPIEGRQGGVIGPVGGLSPNSVTLRGKGDGNAETSNNYPYLISKRTTDPDLNFGLSSGSRRPDPSNVEYRKAIIILEPQAVGYKITVQIVTGGAVPEVHTVINKYAYNQPAPATVKYGIASSTGSEYNFHEIRNIRVNTFEPIANDDLNNVTRRNTPVPIRILDNDIEGIDHFDPASITISGQTAGSVISKDPVTGIITYTPPLNFVGKDTFYYIVKDINGLSSNLAKVEVTSQITTVKPKGVADISTTLLNTPVTINILTNDTDANNGVVTVSSGLLSTQGGTVLVNSNGTITYTPKAGFFGTDTFTYTLKNVDDLVSDPVTVTVTVNSPPTANDDTQTVQAGQPVDVDILTNDTDADGTLNKASIIITDLPQGTVVVNSVTGTVKYTSPVNFVGKDIFYYTVKDDKGAVSNKAKVEITIKPAGSNDNVSTLINTPVTINVLSNDASKLNVTVVPVNQPVKGSIIVNADNTVKYTPLPTSTGNDTFTYKLRTADGTESDPITVTIFINDPPKANNDNQSTLMDQLVAIDVPANDTDADGTINKSSVVIKTQPIHGQIVGVPDAQGIVTYKPEPGYIGTDIFTYTIKDNNGAESGIATVTINISSVPKIGISKALTSVKNSINGTFVVRFTFTVGNYGKESLEKVSIKDDLAATFPGTEVKVIAINSTGTLKTNSNFNGFGDIELLNSSSTLEAGAKETVELILNIILLTSDGTYQNSAVAEAYSKSSGKKTADQSVDGDKPDPFVDGDVTPSGPTFFQLKKGPLYIPEGFSPNGDGTNDLFIVSNSQGRQVSLEVFNRWGNRVYKSSAYKNDWDGRCTEGIFVGQDLPVGTYYYLVVIDNKEKYMGYLTINR